MCCSESDESFCFRVGHSNVLDADGNESVAMNPHTCGSGIAMEGEMIQSDAMKRRRAYRPIMVAASGHQPAAATPR
jgi:hypothetical protein